MSNPFPHPGLWFVYVPAAVILWAVVAVLWGEGRARGSTTYACG